MKYCITCQIKSNRGLKFVAGQCEPCFKDHPLIDVVYVRPKKRCCICNKPVKNVCLYCKGSKEQVEKTLNPQVKKVKKFLCPEFKTCKNCKKEKHNTYFYVLRGYLMSWCKKCHNKRTTDRTLDNKE